MATSLVKLMETLQRARDGAPCSNREWETRVIPETVKKYLKKYNLQHTFNKEEPVNQDLELADRFFEAALEMAAEIGILMVDTESVIRFSREEILEAVDRAPDHVTVGKDSDRITIQARRPEDPVPPVFGGPLSIQVSEELYVPITEGILRSPSIKVQEGPSIDTVFGLPVYSGTPFETAVALRENRLRAEAQWRAGRTGIPNMSIASSTTEYGQLGGFPGQTSLENPSICLILHPAELKIHYASFHKAVVGMGYGGYIYSGSYAMIGGYSGGAEGATLTAIATDLLQYPIMQCHFSAGTIYDIRFDSSCNRHSLWAMSVSNQAISRNTHLLFAKVINQTAGPGTYEILWNCSAGLLCAGVSGMTYTIGPRSAGGRFKDYLTPLEAWFSGQVFEASAGVSLEKANEIVLYLLSKYEDRMKEMPKGQSFPECFDIRTLEPSPEWRNIYDQVCDDLATRGLVLDRK